MELPKEKLRGRLPILGVVNPPIFQKLLQSYIFDEKWTGIIPYATNI